MKTIPTFCFIDEPQFRVNADRAHVAHLLRSYRKQSPRYSISRKSTGVYHVKHVMSAAVAAITTR